VSAPRCEWGRGQLHCHTTNMQAAAVAGCSTIAQERALVQAGSIVQERHANATPRPWRNHTQLRHQSHHSTQHQHLQASAGAATAAAAAPAVHPQAPVQVALVAGPRGLVQPGEVGGAAVYWPAAGVEAQPVEGVEGGEQVALGHVVGLHLQRGGGQQAGAELMMVRRACASVSRVQDRPVVRHQCMRMMGPALSPWC
jgi:hypothetical protein